MSPRIICRCLVIVIALCRLAGAQGAATKPIDPAKAALIDEMMKLTRPDRTMGQFLQQSKVAFSKGFEESFRNQLTKYHEDPAKYQAQVHGFEDRIFGVIADRMDWDKMKPKFVAIYDETFSKQELSDIVNFYKTPSGQSMLQKMPGLIAKGAQVGQAEMGGATAEVQKLMVQFMQDVERAHGKASSAQPKE